jgi:2-isopropylmalate synthase
MDARVPVDNQIRIFDTTLRDGEQSPGASMTTNAKLEAARQLDRLGVDVIEAGFPAASPGDAAATAAVAGVVEQAEVAALARCVRTDIDAAAEAIRDARRPVLHVFVATSDIHLKYKLRRSRTEVLDSVVETVAYAASFGMRVEFSAEDATRSDLDFLACVCNVAVRAGATTVNLPDTVGYSLPDEYATMFRYVRERVTDGEDVVFSAHCHDDLGLATANTLAAIEAGARQVEVTVNGLGERAGNAPLEEVVMAIKTRSDAFGTVGTAVKTRELVRSSELIARLTGLPVQANKAIVGANAFAHEAGIHQDGVIKERSTYEIMSPEDVGWESSRLVLGKHSGRHGLAHRLAQLGIVVDGPAMDEVYAAFIEVADREKNVSDEHLRDIATAALWGHAQTAHPVVAR